MAAVRQVLLRQEIATDSQYKLDKAVSLLLRQISYGAFLNFMINSS